MENFLNEAFQRLSLLEDDFNISNQDKDVIDELKSYVTDDVEPEKEVEEIDVVDPEAATENDLADNYVGKIILECDCCHSRIYKDEADVIISAEDNLANIDEECPVCNNALGYTVIGKIEPFEKDRNIEVEAEETEAEGETEAGEAEEVEETEDVDVREAFKQLHRKGRKITEKVNYDELITDEEEAVTGYDKAIAETDNETEDELLTHIKDEENEHIGELVNAKNKFSEKLTNSQRLLKALYEEADDLVPDDIDDPWGDKIKNPDEEEELTESVEVKATEEDSVEVNKNDDGTLDIKVGAQTGEGEEIVPLTNEEQTEIETNSEAATEEPEELALPTEEELPEETGEELPEEEVETAEAEETEEVEESVNEFTDKKFNKLTEAFIKRVYDNVSSFEATHIKDFGESLEIEGVISFKSGAKKNTSFIFESISQLKNGKILLEGFNQTFSNGKKAFALRCSLKNKMLVVESFKYDYLVNQLNESNQNEQIRVHGRFSIKK